MQKVDLSKTRVNDLVITLLTLYHLSYVTDDVICLAWPT